MEQWCDDFVQQKLKKLGENSVSELLHPSQISHNVAWY
jgi:hypothetical protein